MKNILLLMLSFIFFYSFSQEKINAGKVVTDLSGVLDIANNSPSKFKEGEMKQEEVTKPGYKYTKKYWITNETINGKKGEFTHHVGLKEDQTQGMVDFVIAEWTYQTYNEKKAIVNTLYTFYDQFGTTGITGYEMTSFIPVTENLRGNEGMRFYFTGESFNKASHAYVRLGHLHNMMEKKVGLYIEVHIPKFK